MFAFTEPLITATKSNLTQQVTSLTEAGAKAFDHVEQIVDLNLSMLRASFEQSSDAARQMITAKNAQEFLAAGAAQWQPQGEKLRTYGRHLADLASTARKDLSSVAQERVVDSNRKMIGIIESATKNAPPVSAPAVALMKTVLNNANAGVEHFSKTTRQAVETMEGNLAAAVSRYAKPAAKPARRAHK